MYPLEWDDGEIANQILLWNFPFRLSYGLTYGLTYGLSLVMGSLMGSLIGSLMGSLMNGAISLINYRKTHG